MAREFRERKVVAIISFPRNLRRIVVLEALRSDRLAGLGERQLWELTYLGADGPAGWGGDGVSQGPAGIGGWQPWQAVRAS